MHPRSFICLILLALFTQVRAQVEYLRLSPAQTITQRVGATDVDLAFSRPQMKGRTVFGQLVPYGKMWRTGANENTTISFSHRVKIGETEVAAGTYALITKPMEERWDIFLYKELGNLDVPTPLDSTKLIYLTSVASYELSEPQETLVINIYDITESSANLGISWDRTAVKIPISFYTQEAMEKMMTKEFKQNIFDYRIAAIYYAQRGINLDKAKSLQELVMSLTETPSAWDHHYYGLILKQLGEKAEARKNFELSLDMAISSKNNDLVAANKKELEESR